METKTTYLEYIDKSRNAFRFYEVTVQDKKVIIRYGRIDNKGTTKELSFVSHSDAFYQANAKIDEKILKGYKIVNQLKQENWISKTLQDCEKTTNDLSIHSESSFPLFFEINFPDPKHSRIAQIIRSALLYISPLWKDLSISFESRKIIEQLFLNREFYTEFPFIPDEDIESLMHRFRYVPPNYWLKYLCGIDVVFNANGAFPEYFGLIIFSETKSKNGTSFSPQFQKYIKSPIPTNIGIKNIFLLSIDSSSRNDAPLSWDILTDVDKWKITKEISSFVLYFHQSRHHLTPTLHINI